MVISVKVLNLWEGKEKTILLNKWVRIKKWKKCVIIKSNGRRLVNVEWIRWMCISRKSVTFCCVVGLYSRVLGVLRIEGMMVEWENMDKII